MEDLAMGDIVRLSIGNIIPSDIKILESKNFFVSQSALTGESEPVEKTVTNTSISSEVGEYTNLCLLGTNVVSGSAIAVIVGVGNNIYFGAMQNYLVEAEEKTSFEKSVDNVASKLHNQVEKLNSQGMRVIGVSIKTNQDETKNYAIEDESDMTLIGFIGFLDPPKESAKEALKYYGVDVTVLTGDNHIVTKKVCEQVGLKIINIVPGPEIENLSDDELLKLALKTNVYAKLNPLQKARIVRVLKNGNKIVGFMGDGINYAIALKESDVGISVDTGVDITKDSATVILLEKDLMVLKEGIIEGRRNFYKYKRCCTMEFLYDMQILGYCIGIIAYIVLPAVVLIKKIFNLS